MELSFIRCQRVGVIFIVMERLAYVALKLSFRFVVMEFVAVDKEGWNFLPWKFLVQQWKCCSCYLKHLLPALREIKVANQRMMCTGRWSLRVGCFPCQQDITVFWGVECTKNGPIGHTLCGDGQNGYHVNLTKTKWQWR
eukprot:14979265-Ditylum_brightwellii.AAC.1